MKRAKSVFFTPIQETKLDKLGLFRVKFDVACENFERGLNFSEQMIMDGRQNLARIGMEDTQEEWEMVKKTYNELCLESSSNIDECFGEFDRLRKRYLWLRVRINEYEDTRNANENQPNTMDENRIELEAVKIPRFYGAEDEWTSFSTLFKTLILDKGIYNKIEKLQYLKTLVRGEAARVISYLEPKEENLEKAWTLLVERFDDKRALKDKQLEKLFDLEPVYEESAEKLRNLHDNAKAYCATLNEVSSEEILIHLLKHKMDEKTFEKYEEQRTDGETLSKFFEFLHNRFKNLEIIQKSYCKHKYQLSDDESNYGYNDESDDDSNYENNGQSDASDET